MEQETDHDRLGPSASPIGFSCGCDVPAFSAEMHDLSVPEFFRTTQFVI